MTPRVHLIEPNLIEIDGVRHRFYVLHTRNECSVWLNGHTHHVQRTHKGGPTHPSAAAATGIITALMPGKILRLEVALGDTVKERQTLAVMESMKMESSLHAPKAGRVAEIRCHVGQAVEMGEVLMVIE